MDRHAKQILVVSLAGILLSGVGATVVQAAPQNDRQQQEDKDQRSNAQKKQQPRSNVQQQQPQRTNVQLQEQPRANVQRQEQPRANVQQQQQQRVVNQRQEQQRVDNLRQQPQRLDLQRQQQQRVENQRLQPRRLDTQHPEQQRLSAPGQRDSQWQQRNNRTNNNYSLRQHVYNDDRYRGSNWRDSGETFNHRQPWEWRSRNHEGRQFISDSRWDREFPGLRSYRWYGSGFWYQGLEYRDLVLFYDDGDELVSIGFWNHGRFIMVRDDNHSYYNDNAFVLGYQNHNLRLQIEL